MSNTSDQNEWKRKDDIISVGSGFLHLRSCTQEGSDGINLSLVMTSKSSCSLSDDPTIVKKSKSNKNPSFLRLTDLRGTTHLLYAWTHLDLILPRGINGFSLFGQLTESQTTNISVEALFENHSWGFFWKTDTLW